MNLTAEHGAGSTTTRGRTPWLLFVFFIAIFLFSNHRWEPTALESDDSLWTRVTAVTDVRPARRVFLSLLGIWGAVSLVGRGFSGFRISGTLAWVALFFVAWSGLSVLWAIDAGMTLRRLVLFSIFCTGALALSVRVSPRDLGLLAFSGSLFYLLLGLVAELSFGTFHPFSGFYRFSGTQIFNLQAVNCACLAISGVVCGSTSSRHKMFYFFGAILGLSFLILTGSRTSFAAAIIAISIYKVLFSSKPRTSVIVFAIVMSLSVSILVLGETAIPFLGHGVNLGRSSDGDATLNGRTWLWMECRGYASHRKIQGYGFNGFWIPEHIENISQSQGWALASAHSVYVDIVLELGLVGAAAFFLLLSGSMLKTRRIFLATRDPGYAFFFCFLVFYVLNSFLESVLIHPGFFSFIAMVIFARLAFVEQHLPRFRSKNDRSEPPAQ